MKLIILILNSEHEPVYAKMKEISQIYLNSFKTSNNNNNDWYEFFYVEFNSNIEGDVLVENNTIYIKGNETFFPGIFEKTIKSMKYITDNFEFSYLMRTNISTFLHLENIHSFVNSLNNNQTYFGGFTFTETDGVTIDFVSGTAMFTSKDVVKYLISQYNTEQKYYVPEDVLFSYIIRDTCKSNDKTQDRIEIQKIKDYKMGYLISCDVEWYKPYSSITLNTGAFNPYLTFPENILIFRVKNGADRNIDIQYHKLLANKLYNIDV